MQKNLCLQTSNVILEVKMSNISFNNHLIKLSYIYTIIHIVISNVLKNSHLKDKVSSVYEHQHFLHKNIESFIL
jgi:hypothetical protein